MMAQRKLTGLQRMALATAYSGAYELRTEKSFHSKFGVVQRPLVWALIADREITEQLIALRKRRLLSWRVDTTAGTIKIKLSEAGIEELDKWT